MQLLLASGSVAAAASVAPQSPGLGSLAGSAVRRSLDRVAAAGMLKHFVTSR